MREHLVKSAGYWFNKARDHQCEGELAEALMAMENAYNHVENAAAAFKRALEGFTKPSEEAKKVLDIAKK